MPDTGPKNLDAMFEDDLRVEALRTDAPDHYTAYADLKIWAMAARTAGRISKALILEETLDQWYDKLPEYWRW